MDTATKTVWRVTPWNNGKLAGQKPPLKLKGIWAIGFDYSLIIERANSSTANCAAVIWLSFVSMMSCRAVESRHARLSCRRRRSDRAVRDHRTNKRRDRCLDHGCPSQIGAVPLSESCFAVASSLYPAVLSDRRIVDCLD
jgi:hypothetical protein